MGGKELEHSKENLIWTGQDHKGRSVSLFTRERDHIIEHHDIMGNNFTAVYDSVEDPDSVYDSAEYDNREVFFKKSTIATYSTNFFTKTIVEYEQDNKSGYIVTSMPSKKEGGNVGQRTYPENEI